MRYPLWVLGAKPWTGVEQRELCLAPALTNSQHPRRAAPLVPLLQICNESAILVFAEHSGCSAHCTRNLVVHVRTIRTRAARVPGIHTCTLPLVVRCLRVCECCSNLVASQSRLLPNELGLAGTGGGTTGENSENSFVQPNVPDISNSPSVVSVSDPVPQPLTPSTLLLLPTILTLYPPSFTLLNQYPGLPGILLPPSASHPSRHPRFRLSAPTWLIQTTACNMARIHFVLCRQGHPAHWMLVGHLSRPP